ncbi:MAG: hypothetical protein U0231_14435 [Nitrospiraceae bacterium]
MIDLGADKFPRPLYRQHQVRSADADRERVRHDRLARTLGVGEKERLFVAGSTHPEEDVLIAAYRTLTEEFPICCSCWRRDISTNTQVEEALRAAGFRVPAWPRWRTHAGDGLVPMVLDTRGELALLYRDAAAEPGGRCAGSIGGHNLLEPSAWGTPVLFGPTPTIAPRWRGCWSNRVAVAWSIPRTN